MSNRCQAKAHLSSSDSESSHSFLAEMIPNICSPTSAAPRVHYPVTRTEPMVIPKSSGIDSPVNQSGNSKSSLDTQITKPTDNSFNSTYETSAQNLKTQNSIAPTTYNRLVIPFANPKVMRSRLSSEPNRPSITTKVAKPPVNHALTLGRKYANNTSPIEIQLPDKPGLTNCTSSRRSNESHSHPSNVVQNGLFNNNTLVFGALFGPSPNQISIREEGTPNDPALIIDASKSHDIGSSSSVEQMAIKADTSSGLHQVNAPVSAISDIDENSLHDTKPKLTAFPTKGRRRSLTDSNAQHDQSIGNNSTTIVKLKRNSPGTKSPDSSSAYEPDEEVATYSKSLPRRKVNSSLNTEPGHVGPTVPPIGPKSFAIMFNDLHEPIKKTFTNDNPPNSQQRAPLGELNRILENEHINLPGLQPDPFGDASVLKMSGMVSNLFGGRRGLDDLSIMSFWKSRRVVTGNNSQIVDSSVIELDKDASSHSSLSMSGGFGTVVSVRAKANVRPPNPQSTDSNTNDFSTHSLPAAMIILSSNPQLHTGRNETGLKDGTSSAVLSKKSANLTEPEHGASSRRPSNVPNTNAEGHRERSLTVLVTRLIQRPFKKPIHSLPRQIATTQHPKSNPSVNIARSQHSIINQPRSPPGLSSPSIALKHSLNGLIPSQFISLGVNQTSLSSSPVIHNSLSGMGSENRIPLKNDPLGIKKSKSSNSSVQAISRATSSSGANEKTGVKLGSGIFIARNLGNLEASNTSLSCQKSQKWVQDTNIRINPVLGPIVMESHNGSGPLCSINEIHASGIIKVSKPDVVHSSPSKPNKGKLTKVTSNCFSLFLFRHLQLPKDLDILYHIYFYHQNKVVFQILTWIVAILNLSYLVFNAVLYPYALHLNLPGPTLGFMFVMFASAWMRYGPNEDDLAFPNIVVGLALGLVLLSNNLMRSTCWVTGIYWDNALHLNHLLFCGFVYWLLRSTFFHRSVMGWTFTFLQIGIDLTNGCANSMQLASSMVYVAINLIGMSFAYFSEIANRSAFLRTQEVYKHQDKLFLAKEQSEALLRMVLPARVIHDLKHGCGGSGYLMNERATFQESSRVSILFADIVGFTEFSARVSAVKLVKVLSEVFSEIDSITESLGLEKIKTIGDCYQCCGGVPEPVKSDAEGAEWAQRIIKLGVEITQCMHITAQRIKYPLKVRVGIHTGSVMAGIMGLHKLKYDVWSQDVDLASLMEQSATPNVPLISQYTYNFLTTHGYHDNMCLVPGVDVNCNEGGLVQTYELAKYSFVKYVDNAPVIVVHPFQRTDLTSTNLSTPTVNLDEPSGFMSLKPKNEDPYPPQKSVKPLSAVPISFPSSLQLNTGIKNDGHLPHQNQSMPNVAHMFDEKPVHIALTTGMLPDDMARNLSALDFNHQTHPLTGGFCDAALEEDYKNDYMEHHGMNLVYAISVVVCVRIMYLIGSFLVLRPSILGYVGDGTAVFLLIVIIVFTKTKYSIQAQSNINLLQAEVVSEKRQFGSVDSMVKFTRWHHWHPNSLCLACLLIPSLGDLIRLQYSTVIYPSFQYSALIIVLFSTTLFLGLRTRVVSLVALIFMPIFFFLYYVGISTILDQWAPLNFETLQVLLVLGVTILIVVITNHATDRQIRRIFLANQFLDRKLNEISLVQKDTERLLLNIFPLDVALRLKLNPTERIADALEDVSIIFGYISNFDTLDLPPGIALKLLNEIICDVDELCSQHHVEKIKTIGTKYLAMAKDDSGNGSELKPHAVRIAEFALDLRLVISSYNDQFFSHMYCNNFMVRIGINCGPVVTGVIGNSKYSFDVWGDAVNVSSRMEANGQDNMIHVSQAVYDKLHLLYDFQARGQVPIKGKGLMSTYFLLGRL